MRTHIEHYGLSETRVGRSPNGQRRTWFSGARRASSKKYVQSGGRGFESCSNAGRGCCLRVIAISAGTVLAIECKRGLQTWLRLALGWSFKEWLVGAEGGGCALWWGRICRCHLWRIGRGRL